MIANDPETFHLDTKFCKNGVIHRKSTGEEERWTQVKKLGEGGHGFVYLQKEVATAELRAVKKIQVDDFESNGLDIKRELCHLIALMDVSNFSRIARAISAGTHIYLKAFSVKISSYNFVVGTRTETETYYIL